MKYISWLIVTLMFIFVLVLIGGFGYGIYRLIEGVNNVGYIISLTIWDLILIPAASGVGFMFILIGMESF